MWWIMLLGCTAQSVLGTQNNSMALLSSREHPNSDFPLAVKLIGLPGRISPGAKLNYEITKVLNNSAGQMTLNSSAIRAAVASHLRNSNLNTSVGTGKSMTVALGHPGNMSAYTTGSAPDMVPMEALVISHIVLPAHFQPVATARAFSDKVRHVGKDNPIIASSSESTPNIQATIQATIPTADVWVPRPTSIPNSASFSKCRGKTGYVADFDHSCQTFFNCLSDGSFDRLSCPAGLLFDQDTLSCQKSSSVICSAELIFDCSGKTGFYTDPFTNDRSSYYFCINGEKSHFRCPEGLLFNENCGACDLPQNCGPVTPASYMLSGPFSRQTTKSALANQAAAAAAANQLPEKSITDLPIFMGKGDFQQGASTEQQQASTVVQQVPGSGVSAGRQSNEFNCFGRNGLFADVASGCTSYWVCVPDGSKHRLQCPAHLRFNELIGACDFPQSVSCNTLTIGGNFCADKIGFYPDPVSNCKSYYFCSVEGRTYSFTCPGILLYNEVNGACDDPQNVDCLVSSQQLDAEFDCTGKAGLFVDQRQGCKVYYSCNAYGKKTRLQCPTGQTFNEQAGMCDFERNVRCGPAQNGGNEMQDSGNVLLSRDNALSFPTAGNGPQIPGQIVPALFGFTGNRPSVNDAIALTNIQNGQGSLAGLPLFAAQQPQIFNQEVQHRDQIIPLNFPAQAINQPTGHGFSDDPSLHTQFSGIFFPANGISLGGQNNPNGPGDILNHVPNAAQFPEQQLSNPINNPFPENNFPSNPAIHAINNPQNTPNSNTLAARDGNLPIFLGTGPVNPPSTNHPGPFSDDRQPRLEEVGNGFNGQNLQQNFVPQPNINGGFGDRPNQSQDSGIPQNNPQAIVPFGGQQQINFPNNRPLNNENINTGGQNQGAFFERPNAPLPNGNPFQEEQQFFQQPETLQNSQQNQLNQNAPQPNSLPQDHQTLQQPQILHDLPQNQPNIGSFGRPQDQPVGPNRPQDQVISLPPITLLNPAISFPHSPTLDLQPIPSTPNFDIPPRINENAFPAINTGFQNSGLSFNSNGHAGQNPNQPVLGGQAQGSSQQPEERQGVFQGNNQAFLSNWPLGNAAVQTNFNPGSGYSGPQPGIINIPQVGIVQPGPSNTDYSNNQNQEPLINRPVISGNNGYFATPATGPIGESYGSGGSGISNNGNPNTLQNFGNNQVSDISQQNSGTASSVNCHGLIGYYPDVNQDCRVYYYCKADGTSFQLRCPADLKYNASLGVCDWPRNVNCAVQRHGPGNIPTWNDAPFFDCQGRTGFFGDSAREFRVFYYCEKDGRKHRFVCPSNLRFNEARSACDWPENIFRGPFTGEQEFDCTGKRGYFGNPNTPSVYYFCDQGGATTKHECPDKLSFNFQIGSCDWPERMVTQGSNNISPMVRELNTNDQRDKASAVGMSVKRFDAQESRSQESRIQQTMTKPSSEAKFACVTGKYGFFADVTAKCQKYFYCRVDGKNFSFTCPNSLRFNDKLGACDLERNVPCLTSGSPGFAQLSVAKTYFDCQGKTGLLPDMAASCRSFFNCEPDGSFMTFACSDGLLFNPAVGACDRAESVKCTTIPPYLKFRKFTDYYGRNVTVAR